MALYLFAMSLIFDNDQFDQVVEENALVLAYFSGANCNVCNSLKPKIKSMVTEEFPSIHFVEIKTEQAMELASRFRVFTIPVVLFFADGREYIREARTISVSELGQKLAKIVQLYEAP